MAKIYCNCKNEYQDNKYGKGIRIGTPKLPKPGQAPEYTCTVCTTKTTKEVK